MILHANYLPNYIAYHTLHYAYYVDRSLLGELVC